MRALLSERVDPSGRPFSESSQSTSSWLWSSFWAGCVGYALPPSRFVAVFPVWAALDAASLASTSAAAAVASAAATAVVFAYVVVAAVATYVAAAAACCSVSDVFATAASASAAAAASASADAGATSASAIDDVAVVPVSD